MDHDKEKVVESMSITVGQLRKLTDKLKIYEDEAELTFEFIMSAFFPEALKRMNKYGNDCFTNGYIQGLKDGKNEDKGNN